MTGPALDVGAQRGQTLQKRAWMIPKHREPTHPGEMLLEEFLRPMKLTQVEAADTMGISLNRLNELIRGKRGVTADTALRLARLLKTTPEFWMNLQAAWDLYHAKHAMAAAG
jgi:addiction module HigA family antidote